MAATVGDFSQEAHDLTPYKHFPVLNMLFLYMYMHRTLHGNVMCMTDRDTYPVGMLRKLLRESN